MLNSSQKPELCYPNPMQMIGSVSLRISFQLQEQMSVCSKGFFLGKQTLVNPVNHFSLTRITPEHSAIYHQGLVYHTSMPCLSEHVYVTVRLNTRQTGGETVYAENSSAAQGIESPIRPHDNQLEKQERGVKPITYTMHTHACAHKQLHKDDLISLDQSFS